MSLDGMTPIPRDAVRAILLTPQHDVLLMRICEPGGTARGWWITPGGGLEPGECIEGGLRRELKEELGLDDFAIGAEIWRRQHTFNWLDRRLCQRERYFIVPVKKFLPEMTDQVEIKVLQEFRWWPLAELQQSGEDVTPRSLAAIVHRFIMQGPPTQALEWEILVD